MPSFSTIITSPTTYFEPQETADLLVLDDELANGEADVSIRDDNANPNESLELVDVPLSSTQPKNANRRFQEIRLNSFTSEEEHESEDDQWQIPTAASE